MEGLEGNSAIFEIQVKAGEPNRPDTSHAVWLARIKRVMKTFLGMNIGVWILPIGEGVYTRSDLWLRSTTDVDHRIIDFDSLNTFLDLDYGSGRWFATMKSSQPLLRTRIRVGFAIEQRKQIVQDHLHLNLRAHFNGGCYESPLQYGDIVKIGALALYPLEINLKAMEKELMRHFNFKYPIAL